MKRITITIFMIAVFAAAHVKAQYDKKLPDITIDYNESHVTFMFEEAYSPYDYIKAEDSLNYLLQEIYGLECAYAYVEEAEGLNYKVFVEIFLCDYNYTPTTKYFHIKCHLFHFTITQKGLMIQDAHISKSGSLAQGDAKVIFNKQSDVGYYLYCNEVLIREIYYNDGGGGYPMSIPVTEDGVYTLEAFICDPNSEEWPHTITYGPVAIPGSVSFFDSQTPYGGTISGLDRYYQGVTSTIAVIGASGASGGPSGGNYIYSWEMHTGSVWQIIPNQSDINCIVNVSGHTTDVSVRRKVTKGGRIAYSNVHKIKCKKTMSVYANPNYMTKTVYTSENPSTNQIRTVQYFDGIGRLMQTVQAGVSPTRADLVSHQEYDASGRESNSWLPVPVVQNNGALVPIHDFINKAINTYSGDLAPYSKSVYEASPLNRIEYQHGPGHIWYNNANRMKMNYLTNVSGNDTLNCIYYTVSDPDNQVITITKVRNYASNELYVTRMEDEDNGVQFQFKDKQDNLILVRQLEKTGANREFADTYYIYDVYNNLRVVLPPLASEALASGSIWTSTTTASLRDYAYLYKYDERGRCIAKKLPGASWIYFVYDHADRLIFTQDGEQRTRNEWSFSLPDVFGRESLVGICSNSLNAFANPLDNTVVNVQRDLSMDVYKGYRITGTVLSSPIILTANYYDNYAFKVKDGDVLDSSSNSIFLFEAIPGFDSEQSNTTGLPTGSITARLTGTGSNISEEYDYTVMYYDNEERLIQTRSTNHMGGYDHTFIIYNFVGQPTSKLHVHSATNQPTLHELYTYTYDHAGRQLTVTHKLNNGTPVTLVNNEYDELGRLKKNKRNNQAALITTFDYNIRSWIQGINNPHFTQALSYYGNNIHTQQWTQSNKPRNYTFSYDPLSRLTAAAYSGDGSYGTSYTYDKHGNIQTLSRSGNTDTTTYGMIDNLTMTYSGNQLVKVEDTGITSPPSISTDFRNGSTAAIEYTYDTNGNLTKDLNKNISLIKYNTLNLPSVITFADGVTVTYLYDAVGSKLSVAYNSGGTTAKTEYAGNKVYKNGTLSMLLTEGGYATLSGTTPTYYYYLSDHQGNNRVVLSQSGTVEQVNNYYPFGGAFGEGVQNSNQPYKYNGKELDRTFELNLYDYGARHYDAAIGRWGTMDPMAEKYYSISPYAYVANNPIRYIDPDGMWIDDYSVNEKEKRITIIKQYEKTDRVFDKDNPKGLEIEKGSFDLAKYRSEGYDIETVVPAGMAITDLGLSIFGGEMAAVKIGSWIGKGVSAWKASRAAKAVDATVEVGANAAKGGGRVFWSGEGAMNTAMNYAKSTNGTTLEMTRAGQNLQKLIQTRNIPWSEARPMWQRLSTKFAQGAEGSVHFFPGTTVNPGSIWLNVEKPILINNGVRIITH